MINIIVKIVSLPLKIVFGTFYLIIEELVEFLTQLQKKQDRKRIKKIR